MADKITPQFKRMSVGASAGLVLSPILNNYLHGAKYPSEFTVTFRNHGRERRPDDWFHPSTHPMWTERQLYLYLTAPTKVMPEVMEFAGALSVTMGTAVHDFIEMCLIDAGVLMRPTGICVNCERPHGKKKNECNEWGAKDEKTKTRGHMDGLLNIEGWGHGGFEFKTSNMMKLGNIEDNDVARFKEKWPQYWWQVQDYMRITGLVRFVVLFLGMGYPWTTKEFVIERDEAHCFHMNQKYLRVIAHAEAGNMPEPCCAPRSATARECSLRMACPVGLM